MATVTASPTMSPRTNAAATSPPSLPPLNTNAPTPRRTSSQRPTSWAVRRMSAYSTTSKASHARDSRPASYVFPAFHSSLSYTLVRDFAYDSTHPMHYGPPPTRSNVSTPADESRRGSDPAIASWDESRFHWSATPPWIAEGEDHESRDQLPAMTFNDGGPPYSEDEDLHSPVVTSSRHGKSKSSASNFERGRSPGEVQQRGIVTQAGGFADQNGPGGAVESYRQAPQHRDSNFAKPLNRGHPPFQGPDRVSEEDVTQLQDDTRYSKDYSFTIASPDEEMHGKAVALFDFASEHENELALTEGQIILVSFRASDGWLVGEDPRTGETGLVPEAFVRLARDIDGGLDGLTSEVTEDIDASDRGSSPSKEPGSATTPRAGQVDFPSKMKHPPVQSSFSTSSKDFSPHRPPQSEDGESSPGQGSEGSDADG